jgi:hypothetical protein
MKKNLAVLLATGLLAVVPMVYGQDSSTTTKDSSTGTGSAIKKDTKTAAKDTGKGVKTAAKDTEKGTKVAAKDTGKGAEVAAKDTGKGAKTVGKDTGKGAKTVGKDTGKGVEKGAKAVEKPFKKKDTTPADTKTTDTKPATSPN